MICLDDVCRLLACARGGILFPPRQLIMDGSIEVHVPGMQAPYVRSGDDSGSIQTLGKMTSMQDIDKIRQQLEQDLEKLVVRAEQIENRLREPGDEDWEEQATQRENDQVLESLGIRAVKEIEEIKQALHRIEHGTYGICAGCKQQIELERLELLPCALKCTKCA